MRSYWTCKRRLGRDVHSENYVHTDKFSLKVLKGSIDKLGEAYRETLKGLPWNGVINCISQDLI